MILDEDTGLYYENKQLKDPKHNMTTKDKIVNGLLKLMTYGCGLILLYLILALMNKIFLR